MSELREAMEALLEEKSKPRKSRSNTKWALGKVKNYFKPIFQKKSYKRKKKKS